MDQVTWLLDHLYSRQVISVKIKLLDIPVDVGKALGKCRDLSVLLNNSSGAGAKHSSGIYHIYNEKNVNIQIGI